MEKKNSSVDPKIEEGWRAALEKEFQKEYFLEMKKYLVNEYSSFQVFPKKAQIFNAFDNTPFEEVKVVILGQDPYHGFGQANGLCFSVNKGIRLPPSLKNIFKEIKDDLSIDIPTHGDLTSWAKQGILLLNATLTVRKSEANSHQKIGWQNFTDAAIKAISDKREGIIFILWGNNAKKKLELIDEKKHHVLQSVHPSPFAARNGFFGCKHFSKTNDILKSMSKSPIDWEIK